MCECAPAIGVRGGSRTPQAENFGAQSVLLLSLLSAVNSFYFILVFIVIVGSVFVCDVAFCAPHTHTRNARTRITHLCTAAAAAQYVYVIFFYFFRLIFLFVFVGNSLLYLCAFFAVVLVAKLRILSDETK